MQGILGNQFMFSEPIKYNKIFFIIVILVLTLLFNTACSLSRPDATEKNVEIIETASRYVEVEELKPDQKIEESIAEFDSSDDFKTINLKISYEITATGDTRKIEFTSTLPADYEYRQEILDYSFSIEPSRIYSADENTYARFIINDPPKHFSIDIGMEMEIYDFDLMEALENQGSRSSIKTSPDSLGEYLKPEPNIEVDDGMIKDIAATFTASSQLDLVEEIYNFVLDNMTYYGYNPGNTGAAEAISSGGGDCTEYSDLFVALCRANSIPARVIEGYVIDAVPDELSLGHNWSEVYIEDLGWIPFDTIYDDNNGDSRNTTFDNLKNIYIYTSFARNDAELFDFHYYSYVYYGDNIDVNKRVFLEYQ